MKGVNPEVGTTQNENQPESQAPVLSQVSSDDGKMIFAFLSM